MEWFNDIYLFVAKVFQNLGIGFTAGFTYVFTAFQVP